MLLDLTHLRQAETDFARQYDPAAFAGRENPYRVVSPVDLRFKIHKDKDRFRLAGTVTAVLELQCGRCLEPFTLPVDASFDLRYMPQSADAGEGEREVEEDDLSTSFYQNDQIDLGQLMEEQFYLALPMKPLCRPDCKGLCPQCGTNLNVETCACDPRWVDPRLAGLKALITERNKDDA